MALGTPRCPTDGRTRRASLEECSSILDFQDPHHKKVPQETRDHQAARANTQGLPILKLPEVDHHPIIKNTGTNF